MKSQYAVNERNMFQSNLAKIVIVAFSLLLVLFAVGCSSNKSASDQSSSSESSSNYLGSSSTILEPNAERSIPDPEAPKITITVEVDPTVANEAGAGIDGFDQVLTFPSLVLTEGDTAIDALFDSGVVVTTSGLYVTDINGLSAGAAGDESGWTYLINGEAPLMNAIDYRLADGDVVTWRYVTAYEV